MSVRSFRQSGATLIELIMFIVIVSVALAGVLSVFNVTVRSSADPLQSKQALAIAEGMLEEVLLKQYCDPNTMDASVTPPSCPARVLADQEGTRIEYDDVDDYNGFTLANASTVTGSYTATGYAVDISVTTTTVNSQAAKEVRVTVTPPSGSAIVLYGYRTNY